MLGDRITWLEFDRAARLALFSGRRAGRFELVDGIFQPAPPRKVGRPKGHKIDRSAEMPVEPAAVPVPAVSPPPVVDDSPLKPGRRVGAPSSPPGQARGNNGVGRSDEKPPPVANGNHAAKRRRG